MVVVVAKCKHGSFILSQLLASCTFIVKILFEINLITNKMSLDSEKSTQQVSLKTKEDSDNKLFKENPNNLFKEN